jgi:hypothetical protein
MRYDFPEFELPIIAVRKFLSPPNISDNFGAKFYSIYIHKKNSNLIIMLQDFFLIYKFP